MSDSVDYSRAAYCPRFKVFLSADIVGSTAYKQPFDMSRADRVAASVQASIEWQNTVQRFYRRLIAKFPKFWTEMASNIGESTSREYNVLAGPSEDYPHFWKTVGDEVIFWKEITSEHQLWLLLSSWTHALSDLREQLHPLNLDVKSTIWTAEFPVRNRVVLSEFNPGQQARDGLGVPVDTLDKTAREALKARRLEKYLHKFDQFYEQPDKVHRSFDFIGPGIDVGFRVSGFCTIKKMALNVDFVYLLSLSALRLLQKDSFSGITKFESDNFKPKFVDDLAKLVKDFRIPSSFGTDKNDEPYRIVDTEIHFGGSEILKGVLGGVKYPKLWIDTAPADSYSKRKELLYSEHHRYGIDWKDVFGFCKSFYQEYARFIQAPVLLASPTCTSTSEDEQPVEHYGIGLDEFRRNLDKVVI